MLPNSQNNSLQVKRIMYSKLKDTPKEITLDEGKKIQELRELFTHSKTFVSSRRSTNSENVSNSFRPPSIVSPEKFPIKNQGDGDGSNNNNKRQIRSTGANTYDYVYPFITETISTKIDPSRFNLNQTYNIHVCIYRVLDSAGHTIPFLQFKLHKMPQSNDMTFPSFKYTRKQSHPGDPITAAASSSCRTRADNAVAGWFKANAGHAGHIEFRGMYEITRDDVATATANNNNHNHNNELLSSFYLIYEELVDSSQYDKLLREPVKLGTGTDQWWWACAYEIFNTKRVLFHGIHSSVLQLFESAPTIMFLYDGATGYILEAPHVLYSGITEGSTLEEMALLGPRKLMDNPTTDISIKDKNEHRMYGSQYYFHELDNAFRSACYTYDPKKNKYAKRNDPYLFRYVVFLGITYVTIMDTDNTTMHKSIDSLVSHQNTTWCSEGYNSIYHGRYDILKHRNENFKFLEPVFCVCDNERIIALSYHKVDASTVPKQFNEGTNTYTII